MVEILKGEVVKCKLPLKYNDKVVGEVFQYQIVGWDLDGLPIVCIDGKLSKGFDRKMFPSKRYTWLGSGEIFIKGIAK